MKPRSAGGPDNIPAVARFGCNTGVSFVKRVVSGEVAPGIFIYCLWEMSADENLTIKQRMFVDEYLTHLDVARAALKCGFSPETGRRLLNRVYVRAAIKKRLEERKKRLKLSEEYVIDRLIREVEKEHGDTHASARVRALELLGRHLGMFWDRQEVVRRSEVVYVEVAPTKACESQRPQALPKEVGDAEAVRENSGRTEGEGGSGEEG